MLVKQGGTFKQIELCNSCGSEFEYNGNEKCFVCSEYHSKLCKCHWCGSLKEKVSPCYQCISKDHAYSSECELCKKTVVQLYLKDASHCCLDCLLQIHARDKSLKKVRFPRLYYYD